MVETLEYGRKQGWKQIIFGHKGRKPEETLAKVAARIGELLKCEVPLIEDWLDESSLTVKDLVAEKIKSAEPGAVMVLENTRRYDIERVLWKAGPDDLAKLSEPLAKFASQMADKVAKVYVNEALSAGSLDTSTVVVPAAMDRVALGFYVAKEFDGAMLRCLDTELVVFSGLKTDKLDDLEAMIAGARSSWCLPRGRWPWRSRKPPPNWTARSSTWAWPRTPLTPTSRTSFPKRRIEQAKRMISEGREKGIEFVLPVDFVLQDGKASETIGPQGQQLDIGPKTSELFEAKIGEFIAQHKGQRAVAFHNGVFGKFEEAQFAEGTKRFVPQLKRLKDAGVEVYVGGGEGGAALERYGSEDDVTHVFTAGGTVLNALGSEPVPYLVALSMAAQQEQG